MINNYVAVNRKTNPVVVKLATMPIETVRYVVEQYSLFPQRIVSYLYAARAAACVSGCTAVDSELTRNIGEEFGTEPNSASHATMLIDGLERGLTMDRVRDASPITGAGYPVS